ncbi:MAG: hypothetical protein ACHRHE_24815 [Tepidisphaerales bacterium]
MAYRGLVPRVDEYPADAMRMWVGQSKHFLVFPVRAGRLLNYVGFVPSDTSVRESWSAPGDPATRGPKPLRSPEDRAPGQPAGKGPTADALGSTAVGHPGHAATATIGCWAVQSSNATWPPATGNWP